MIFKKKYVKKTGEPWNRKGVMQEIAKTLIQSGLKTAVKNGSYMTIADTNGINKVRLSFTTNNFSEVGELELNANIEIDVHGKKIEWVDLFHLARQFVPRGRRPLNIRKDENWEQSALHKETCEVYAPIFKVLLDDLLRDKFFSGEPVQIGGKKIKLSGDGDNGWILESSKQLLH